MNPAASVKELKTCHVVSDSVEAGCWLLLCTVDIISFVLEVVWLVVLIICLNTYRRDMYSTGQ